MDSGRIDSAVVVIHLTRLIARECRECHEPVPRSTQYKKIPSPTLSHSIHLLLPTALILLSIFFVPFSSSLLLFYYSCPLFFLYTLLPSLSFLLFSNSSIQQPRVPVSLFRCHSDSWPIADFSLARSFSIPPLFSFLPNSLPIPPQSCLKETSCPQSPQW